MSLGRKRGLCPLPDGLYYISSPAGQDLGCCMSCSCSRRNRLCEDTGSRKYGLWPCTVSRGMASWALFYGASSLWDISGSEQIGCYQTFELPHAHTHAHSALRTIIITSSQSHPIKRRKTFLATSCTNQFLIKDVALIPNVSGNKPNQRAYWFLGAPLLAPVPADISVW